MIEFAPAFKALTGNPPFPWQQALYERFAAGDIPASCNLPTGLGKTSVIAVWLIARANNANVPRRLVYVVNRRTVVDQTTDEVEKYKRNAVAGIPDFAVSTLRGQFADNREWSADPSRPAVICGTVDMIGSRLLFNGYGVGMKDKPLHAGFLGQDSLLVHDEAHLEPAFQTLIETIRDEQKREREGKPAFPWSQLRVMALTATPRGSGDVFELTKDEREVPSDWEKRPKEPIRYVWQRLKSKKALAFQSVKRDAVAKTIGETARSKWAKSEKAVLVFVRTIDDVKSVYAALTDKKNGGVEADHVQLLTGTLRGLERDRLATTDTVFARFTPEPKVTPKQGTVFLVCTSAGEVGVDISADHMVSDLTTLDSMAQRFGRVNRRGEGAAEIDVVYETDPDPKTKEDGFEQARWKTKEVLERLPKGDRHDASPFALRELMGQLPEAERDAAFAPTPVLLPATDILFDAWALTTIRDKLPGRPPVEPYLHGLPTSWQPPETHVAWREEVEKLHPKYESDEAREQNQQADRKALAKLAGTLLEDFPLKPHELLQDRMTRVRAAIDVLAESHPNEPAWVMNEDDEVTVTTLGELMLTEKKDGKTVYKIDSRYGTILLPPSVGGLNDQGMLDPKATQADDVSCEWFEDKEQTKPRRARGDDEDPPEGMRLVRRIQLPCGGGDDAETEYWYWFARGGGDDDASKSAREPIKWQHHTDDVKRNLVAIAGKLFPNDTGCQRALKLAADWHDLGKMRVVWQRSIGNPRPTEWYAKSGKDPHTKRMWKSSELTDYRHEFGSLIDLLDQEQVFRAVFDTLSVEHRELVLHLIAAHHGRAPLRLFQALVSAAATRWRDDQFREYAQPALSWLERHSPSITAPPVAAESFGYRAYVPNNSGDLMTAAWARGDTETSMAKFRVEKDVRPTHLSGETVHYLYPLPDGGCPFEEVLKAAARSITHLGWGIDMVTADAKVITQAEADELPGHRWRVVPDGGTPLRVPKKGTLEDLIRKHAAFLGRLSADGFKPVPPLQCFDVVGYASPTVPSATPAAPRPVAAFEIHRTIDDQEQNHGKSRFRAFHHVRAVATVAGMVRHATATAAGHMGHPIEWVNTHVLGHGDEKDGQATSDRRLMFLPLPSIQPVVGVGGIRRVLVVGWPGWAGLADLRRRLNGAELIERETCQPVAVLSQLATSDKEVRRFTDPARTWTTVTPVILPGHDDPDGLRKKLQERVNAGEQRHLLERLDSRIVALLWKAFHQAGWSADALAGSELEYRRVGWLRGLELAGKYVLSKVPYPRYHVRVTFRQPVRGPVAVGAGRYRGFGLFVRESESFAESRV